MDIDYNLDTRLKTLQTLLKAYQEWFASIVQAASFKGKPDEMPQSYLDVSENLSLKKIDIDTHYTQRTQHMQAAHIGLQTLGAKYLEALSAETFSTFSSGFQSFIAEVLSLNQALILEEWGLDILTGLKNNHILETDLKIEMERLSREGNPFCLALARIDDFEKIEGALGKKQADEIVKTVSQLVRKSLRSYDDAYRIQRDHFIMCLKQSELIGGQKALERLRTIFEGAGESYELNGDKALLSLSCCVAMPMVGDNIHEMIENLYLDLDNQAEESGTVVTYRDISPLERFMNQDKK